MGKENRNKRSEVLNSKTEEILSYIREKSQEDLHDKDIEELINELQLYQSELEIQIEELKKSRENLENSRRQYFELYNLAPAGYFTLTARGIIEQANLTGAEMLGVPRRMLRGARFADYVNEHYRDNFHSHILDLIKSEENQSCELKMKTVNGNEFWIEMKSIPQTDEAGEVTSVRAAIMDITERKKREDIEQKLKDVLKTTPDAVIMHNLMGTILAWNNGATNLYGYKESEALKMNIDAVIPSAKKKEMVEIRRRLQSGEKTISMETLRSTRIGKILHIYASFFSQFDADGKLIAISSIEHDITEQKKHEADRKRLIMQLVREQRLLETIINQLPVGIIIGEPPDGKVILKNSLVDKIFRYTWDSPQSYDEYCTQRKIFHPDGNQYKKEEIPLFRALKMGEMIENEIAQFERGDGTRGMLNMNASPVRNENGEIIAGIAIMQDITSQIEEEQQIREGREFADNIIASMGDGLMVLDENMKVVRCNLSYGKTFKVDPADVEGKALNDPGTANWDNPELGLRLKELLEKNKAINDFEIIKEFPGIDRRIIIINGRPILGREGKPTQILLTFKDVTDQRAAEEEIQRLNAMLLKRYVELQNVNRELEAFTYSVSHDLRGPLRAMDGFSRLLQEEYANKLDEKGLHYLERIRSGADSMSQLIDDLLRLSRISQTDIIYEDVNLSEIAAEFAEELRQSSSERNVIFDIQPDLIVRGDNNLLKQLMENLMRNAWKYSKGKSGARIEFGMQEIEGERTYFVRDNGAGFDMKYVDRLFMPFQRLHSSREYSGTGIGLSIVKRIVDGHDGKIWAKAKEGEGATFYFTLGNQEE